MADAPGDRPPKRCRRRRSGRNCPNEEVLAPPSPGLVARELWPVVASATLIYLASTAFTTAVPLWLTAEGNGQRIGWTLAAYSLAAAGRGLLAAALASRSAAATLFRRTIPGSIAWR